MLLKLCAEREGWEDAEKTKEGFFTFLGASNLLFFVEPRSEISRYVNGGSTHAWFWEILRMQNTDSRVVWLSTPRKFLYFHSLLNLISI